MCLFRRNRCVYFIRNRVTPDPNSYLWRHIGLLTSTNFGDNQYDCAFEQLEPFCVLIRIYPTCSMNVARWRQKALPMTPKFVYLLICFCANILLLMTTN